MQNGYFYKLKSETIEEALDLYGCLHINPDEVIYEAKQIFEEFEVYHKDGDSITLYGKYLVK